MKNIKNVIKFDAETVSTLFSGGTPFLIPPLQRTYQWDKEIEALWNDLHDYRELHNMSKDYQYELGKNYIEVAPYLIGSIYVCPGFFEGGDNEQVFEVLDGQQRLTTLLIGLLVLREIYHTVTSDPTLNDIVRQIDSKKKELKQRGPSIIFDRQVDNVIYDDPNGPKLRYAQKSTNEFWSKLVNASGTAEIQAVLASKTRNETEANIAKAFNTYREKIFSKLETFSEIKFVWNKKEEHWNIDTLVKRCTPKKSDAVDGMQSGTKILGDFLTCLCGMASTILHCVGLARFTCEQPQISLFDIINNRGKTFEENDLTRIVLLSACSIEVQAEVLGKWNNIIVDRDLLTWCWNGLYAKDVSQMAKRQIHYQIDTAIKEQTDVDKDDQSLWVKDFVDNVSDCFHIIENLNQNKDLSFGSLNFYRDAICFYFDYDKFSMPVILAIETFIKDDLVLRQLLYKYLFNVLIRIKVGKENNIKDQTSEIPRLAVRICKQIRECHSNRADRSTVLNSVKNIVETNPVYKELLEDQFFTKAFSEFSLVSEKKNKEANKFGYLLVSMFENEQAGHSSVHTLSPYGGARKTVKQNNLEHIFPQTENPAYGWVISENVDNSVKILNKLGNLLPLNALKNSELCNFSLEQKVKTYAESGLQCWPQLRALLEEGCEPGKYSWTFEKIEKRSEQLAQIAKDLFSLNITQK